MKTKIIPLIIYAAMLVVVITNIPLDDYIVVENRNKLEFPVLTMTSLVSREYQDGIENYFSDQIIAEKKLIEIKSTYEILIGDGMIRNSVLVGDNMFFSKLTSNDFNGVLLSDEKLKETLGYLDDISHYYSEQGYDFYFAVGPNKASLYPENFPIGTYSDYHIMNQITSQLSTLPNIQYVDIYKTLADYKTENDEQLYFSYDSHWNYLGGYLAADTLIQAMYPNNDFGYDVYRDSLVYDKVDGQDLANIIGVSNLYYDITFRPEEVTNYYLPSIEQAMESNEELIVIRDSYFNHVAPVFEYLDASRKYTFFYNEDHRIYQPTMESGKVLMLVVERNIYDSIKNAYRGIIGNEVVDDDL